LLKVKPHGGLVPVSCTHCCASTPGLSTSWSSRRLQSPEGEGISCFGASFPLRCFQRLSHPDIATWRCNWRHNQHTRGPSIPVLSY